MSQSLSYLLDRAREPSSWRGVIWLLTACGVSVAPDTATAIMTAGASAAGLIGVLTRDPSPPAG